MAAAVLSAIWLALAACEPRAPELRELQWQLLDFHDRTLERRYEALSLFARVSDADGLDDLDELYLIFDAGELYWHLSADVWVQMERDGATWIGSTNLAMPGQEPFPAGEYRVLVVDIGGERAETRFLIPAARSATPAPEVTAAGPRFAVRGTADYVLWVLADGELVATLEAAGTVDLTHHLRDRAESSFEVYVFGKAPDADKGTLAGPYTWRRP